MPTAPRPEARPRTSGPGRPRSPEADEAILRAATELLDEVGMERLTIEGVAQRAGVAKTTVYRRWKDKHSLLAAALDAHRPPIEMPDTGSLAGDLTELFRRVEESGALARTSQTLWLLVVTYTEHDEFREVYWRQFVEPRRAGFTEIITRAQVRGEARSDLDLEILVDVLAGAIFYQLLRPGDESLSERMERVVELLRPALVGGESQ